jgi:hypothetical protein
MSHLHPAGDNRKRKKRIASRKAQQRANSARKRHAEAQEEALAAAAPAGRLERTRRLILAALRVWELKRKIHD